MARSFRRVVVLLVAAGLVSDSGGAASRPPLFHRSLPPASGMGGDLFQQQAIVSEAVEVIREMLPSKPGLRTRRLATATLGLLIIHTAMIGQEPPAPPVSRDLVPLIEQLEKNSRHLTNEELNPLAAAVRVGVSDEKDLERIAAAWAQNQCQRFISGSDPLGTALLESQTVDLQPRYNRALARMARGRLDALTPPILSELPRYSASIPGVVQSKIHEIIFYARLLAVVDPSGYKNSQDEKNYQWIVDETARVNILGRRLKMTESIAFLFLFWGVVVLYIYQFFRSRRLPPVIRDAADAIQSDSELRPFMPKVAPFTHSDRKSKGISVLFGDAADEFRVYVYKKHGVYIIGLSDRIGDAYERAVAEESELMAALSNLLMEVKATSGFRDLQRRHA